jgi:D-psicose/D-tagatose/L-ribulose 3-epimerase
MKLGVSAFAWTAQFEAEHLDLVPVVRAMGLEALEIALFEPAQLAATQIRRAFAAADLECTVCAILPAGINPISPDAAVRACSLRHLTACVETAAACGAKLLGGPLFAPIGYLPEHRPTPDEWQWAVEAFQALGPVLDAHQMTLSIEPVNRAETFFLRTAKEARALCLAVGHPRVGVTIDTFHANIEEKKIEEAVSLLGPLLKHIHASENDRGILGEGHIDFAAIAAAAGRIGYDGYWMIEGFGYAPHEKNAPGFLWAAPDVSPEDLAVKSAHYLNRLLAR